MPPLKGRKSLKKQHSLEYKRSWRAQRREQYIRQRDAIRDAAPPMLLGPRTDILTVLAACGPVRMVALQELFGEGRVHQARKGNDGFCFGWQLPGSDKRGQRGAALALDPEHPLYREARALLLVLAEQFPHRARRDMFDSECIVPAVRRRYQLETMLGRPNRLHVLATLEALGGSTTRAALTGAAQGMRDAVIQQTVKKARRDEIVSVCNGVIAFSTAPWIPALRKLLRAYLRQRPKFMAHLRASRKKYAGVVRERWLYTLFGRVALRRALSLIATDGPLPLSELLAGIASRREPTGLTKLLQVGILARELRTDRFGGYYVYGFNASYPLFSEVMRLFASFGGGKPSRKQQLRVEVKQLSIRELFTSPLFFNVLMSIEMAVNGAIDPATVCRFHGGHDVQLVMRRMREWSQKPNGLLQRWAVNGVTLYRFNPAYPHSRPLRALLFKIAHLQPQWRTLASLEPASYVSTRQMNAHRRLGM